MHDGRVMIGSWMRRCPGVRGSTSSFRRLAEVYSEVTAPFGRVGTAGIGVSTKAIEGDEATYQRLEDALLSLTADRDAVAAQMQDMLEAGVQRPADQQARGEATDQGGQAAHQASRATGQGLIGGRIGPCSAREPSSDQLDLETISAARWLDQFAAGEGPQRRIEVTVELFPKVPFPAKVPSSRAAMRRRRARLLRSTWLCSMSLKKSVPL